MSEDRAVYQTEAGPGPEITHAQELELLREQNRQMAEVLRNWAGHINSIQGVRKSDARTIKNASSGVSRVADILEGKPGAALEGK